MRLAVVALLAACSSSPPNAPSPVLAPPVDPVARPRIVAHRGASFDEVENSLAAFTRAWQLGVECAELDVHLTRDGAAVVIHDPTTKRLAGIDVPVAAQTLAELRALDVGAWKGPQFAGTRIATLGEVLDTIPPGRTMFVEIKSPIATADAVARAVLAADPRPRGGKLALQGFDPEALAAFSRALPGVPAYWTVGPPMTDDHEPLPYPREVVDEAVRRGFAGIALLHVSTTDELVAAARKADLLVDVWTLNEPAEIAHWYARDVRWIETDRPDLAPQHDVPPVER